MNGVIERVKLVNNVMAFFWVIILHNRVVFYNL
jgi:hypothetical protein